METKGCTNCKYRSVGDGKWWCNKIDEGISDILLCNVNRRIYPSMDNKQPTLADALIAVSKTQGLLAIEVVNNRAAIADLTDRLAKLENQPQHKWNGRD